MLADFLSTIEGSQKILKATVIHRVDDIGCLPLTILLLGYGWGIQVRFPLPGHSQNAFVCQAGQKSGDCLPFPTLVGKDFQ